MQTSRVGGPVATWALALALVAPRRLLARLTGAPRAPGVEPVRSFLARSPGLRARLGR